MKKGIILSLVMMTALSHTYAFADNDTELAKKSQNPTEKMVQVPFNNNFNFGYGDHGNTQYVLDIEPVIPFTLNENWNLILRTIVPVMRQPSLLPARGYLNGIGDINPTFYLVPANPGKVIFAIGPTIVFPTATRQALGQGKYSIGPSFVIVTMPGNWVVGFMMFNYWSIGGQSNRPNANSFETQYFINYNMPDGWYVTSQPIITADWTATSTDRWLVPIGGGFGRVFQVGKQAVNISIQAYTNVVTASYGPNWQAQLNLTLLFPSTDS